MDPEKQAQLVQLIAISKVMKLEPVSIPKPITLDLPRWTRFTAEQEVPNDVTQIREVLHFFNEIVSANSLRHTTAAKKLTEALDTLNSVTPEADMTHILMCDRLSFGQQAMAVAYIDKSFSKVVALDPESESLVHELDERGYTLNNLISTHDELRSRDLISIRDHIPPQLLQKVETLNRICKDLVNSVRCHVPIFNIWDSISLIYTLCVEPVTSNQQAELHLFQFRSMIQILAKHWYTGRRREIAPSTVAATWSEPDPLRAESVAIAFATTCSGRRKQKADMANARTEFTKHLITSLDVLKKTSGDVLISFGPGNCPEWVTLTIICRSIGRYSSLCQTVSKDFIYKMCDYCAEFASALENMGVNILDLWAYSDLSLGEAVEMPSEEGFSYRALMKYSTVAEKFNQVRGVV